MDKSFNQKDYIKEWQKENMKTVSARYKADFVDEFKAACNSLGLVQSQVFKKAMQNVIDEHNKKRPLD